MSNSQNKVLATHIFSFGEASGVNGGEDLTVKSSFMSNGDDGEDGVYLCQEITLHSYCNSASFHLNGITITPEALRKLANELEATRRISISLAAPKQIARSN